MADAEEDFWEDEQGMLVLSMRARIATLISGLSILAAASAPKAAPRIHLPPELAVLSLAVLVSLLVYLVPVRNKVKEPLAAPLASDPCEEGARVNPGRLIFLLFGFLGLSNITQIPVASLPEALWQWSAGGILGLVQIWIGFSLFWKKGQEVLISRRTCYLCLSAGLWAIVPPLLDHLGNWVLRPGGLLLDWSAVPPVVQGLGRLPFLSGVVGWALACSALYLLWRSRHEGPTVDLARFLRSMAEPIGICLLVIGVLTSLVFLGALSSDSIYGENIGAVGFLGVWALLSFLVALPLCRGRGPESFRWRMVAYLFCWIAFLSYLLIVSIWYRFWPLLPALVRLAEISRVLSVVVFLFIFLSILVALVARPRWIKRRTLELVVISLGLLYVTCWLAAIVGWSHPSRFLVRDKTVVSNGYGSFDVDISLEVRGLPDEHTMLWAEVSDIGFTDSKRPIPPSLVVRPERVDFGWLEEKSEFGTIRRLNLSGSFRIYNLTEGRYRVWIALHEEVHREDTALQNVVDRRRVLLRVGPA